MSNDIKLSEKHGLNPTIPLCFWCGEEKGEIALLGRLPEDEKAPKSCILDYEPCDKCKAEWDKGIHIIEAVKKDKIHDNRPPITEKEGGLYPTGRMVVITYKAAERIFGDTDYYDKVLEVGGTLVDEEVFDMMFKDLTEDKEDGKE